MRIALHFINWNDSFYLPFIKANYSYCEKIVMWDNYSTDHSVKIAKELGFEVRSFGVKGQLNDQHYIDVKNHCWKEDKEFDYVIVCDADEFLKGDVLSLTSSLPKVQGYNMISDGLNIENINTGYPNEAYSKRIIFDPKRIHEINFVHGCHVAKPQGDITEHDQMCLYHYRCVGGFERLWNRHQEYQRRLSTFNRRHRMGHHYLVDKATKRNEWQAMKSMAYEIY